LRYLPELNDQRDDAMPLEELRYYHDQLKLPQTPSFRTGPEPVN
jgi:hypothetical protein